MSVYDNRPKPSADRGYIIALSKWRSRLALLAGIVTVSFSLYAIAGGMVYYAGIGRPVGELFRWFTTNSNLLTALSAFFLIPFAVEGIRKKHYSQPKWVAMFHYCGMVCTTLTMVFSLGIMSWVDPEAAFGGYNLYLHILCPIMVIVSFFLVESGFRFTLKNALFAAIPALLYEAIYFCEVVVIGKANGGWEDMYHMTEYLPAAVSALIVTGLALGISLLIRRLYNGLTTLRLKKTEAGLWPEDADPVEINIEMFGLGRYMGKHADVKYIELPLDLIRMIADKYGLSAETLIKPYMRGVLDGIEEKHGK